MHLQYCKRIIFSVYDIGGTLNFLHFSEHFIWHLIYIDLFIPLLIHMIWQRDKTARGVRNNTRPNVMNLQYLNPTLPVLGRIVWAEESGWPGWPGIWWGRPCIYFLHNALTGRETNSGVWTSPRAARLLKETRRENYYYSETGNLCGHKRVGKNIS